jgi:predicted metal-dependent hydrolase
MSELTEPGIENCQGPLHPKAIEGMEAFNTGNYFKAHEALETAWRDEFGPIRDLYRGILQVSVVYLHITRHNFPGAIKVHHRSQKWLQSWPETCRGISVGQLRRDLEAVILALQPLGSQHIAEFDKSLFKPIQYSKSEHQ